MGEADQNSRLEALSVENQLLQQQLVLSKEELKLEAENSRLRERLARQQLRKKLPKRNILGQVLSRSPKPIARFILWLARFVPFFFAFNILATIARTAAGGKENSYTILLGIVKAMPADKIEGGTALIEALAMRAKNFVSFSGFMLILLLWLSYTTLRWYYNGSPTANNAITRLAQNPFLALFVYSSYALSFCLGTSTHDFYAAIQSIDNENVYTMQKPISIPEDIYAYLRLMIFSVIRMAFWTIIAVCLNKNVQRQAVPKEHEMQHSS